MMSKCVENINTSCCCLDGGCKYKFIKLMELNEACENDILNGFYSSASGASEYYTFNYQDQLNITGAATALGLGIKTTVDYKSTNQLFCITYTVEQFK